MLPMNFFLVMCEAHPLWQRKMETKEKCGLGCISASLVLLHACWRTKKSVSTDPAAKPK